ncbi:hypothetical protein Ahy_B06g083294 [Arachis hypogaea]|uniref:Aminotransferase-like plant mobile domain-containing protein n=1 Tax=Arachis hypogaea TaxID=3818 RepID=A0A444YPU1_ARAHY|nr:hypothetical protein Ahy_B06g083294 [Arachis hypogaea]
MLKLVWLQDRVRQMPQIDDPETLRQYARCYIMLLIGGYLMTDKSNNMVHLRWLPLLRDFAECRAFFLGLHCAGLDISVPFFGGSTGRHGYHWLHSVVDVLDISEILPVQSRDQYEARILHWRVSLDRLRFDEFAWKVYDNPALQALCLPWFREEEE